MIMTTPQLIEHLKNVLGLKNDNELAERLGMKAGTLAMCKSRQGGSIQDFVLKLAAREGLDLNLLLLKRGAGTVEPQLNRISNDIRLGRAFLASKLLHPDRLMSIRVRIAITPLQAGDLAIIDKQENTISCTGIYAIQPKGLPVQLKRITVGLDGSLSTPSDDPSSSDSVTIIAPGTAEKLNIIGRVILNLTSI